MRVGNELYICRYSMGLGDRPQIGLVLDKGNNFREDVVIGNLSRRLGSEGIKTVSNLAECGSFGIDAIRQLAKTTRAISKIDQQEIEFLSCLDRQEVEAAGVTYRRSVLARGEESGTDIYQDVANNVRPEIFGKSAIRKVIGHSRPLGIRSDSLWNVPEPELTIIFNSGGQIFGYTVGNDMSSRDIEGENPLYLPQAKVYDRSCGIGPFMRVGVTEDQIKEEAVIRLEIVRNGKPAIVPLEGKVSDIQRTFTELRNYLFKNRTFNRGVALLTGTNIVPEMKDVHPEANIVGIDIPGKEGKKFTLEHGDKVFITIKGVGILDNRIVRLKDKTDELLPVDLV